MVECNGEAASLISKEVAIDFLGGHENKMCAQVAEFLMDIFHGVIEEVGHGYWNGGLIRGTGLGGSDPLPMLVHVTIFLICGDGDVVVCLLQC